MLKEKLKGKDTIIGAISVFLIISMFVFIGYNAVIGILMGVLGVMLLPAVNSKINEKFVKGSKVRRYIKITLEVILFLIISLNVPDVETNTKQEEILSKNDNTISEEIADNSNKANENKIETNLNENTTQNDNSISQDLNVQKSDTETVNKEASQPVVQSSTKTPSTNAQSTGSGYSKSITSSSKSTGTTSSSTNKSSSSTSKKSTGSSSATITDGQTVYVTPTGKRYHLKASCAGKNATPSTVSKAKARGLTPCKKCAQ